MTVPPSSSRIALRSMPSGNSDSIDSSTASDSTSVDSKTRVGSTVTLSLIHISPLAALDLPLKVLVWDEDGQTKVSYYAPAALAAHHKLSAELTRNLSGLDAVVDALVVS